MANLLRVLFVACLALVLLTAGTALAKTKAGTFTITPSAGYQVIDGAMGIEDSAAFGLGVGYSYTPAWAVEADVRFTPTEAEGASSADVDIWSFSLGAIYHFNPHAVFDPYFSVGGGLMSYQTDAYDDEDLFGYYGGGLKYGISESTDLRLDLRHILDYRSDNSGSVHDSADWRHHMQAMLGVTFRLGKAAEPVPAAHTATTPAPLTAPTDSDRDGVLDSLDKCPGTSPGVRVDASGCPADTDGDGVEDYRDACIDTPRDAAVDAYGCPEAVAEIASLTLHILFGVDKSEVTPFHAAELRQAADFIARYPMYDVLVEGHTDAQGDDDYNLQLSRLRAESVRQALIDKYGFRAHKISAAGFGESRPVGDNATEEGRRENRRVVISIRP